MFYSKRREATWKFFRAENETRTRDPNLGKVMLYQLSYFRIMCYLVGNLAKVIR